MHPVQVEFQDDPIEHSRDGSTIHGQTVTIHHLKRSRIPSISIAIPPGVPVTWTSVTLPNGKLVSTYSVGGGEPITQEGYNFEYEDPTPLKPQKESSDFKSEDIARK